MAGMSPRGAREAAQQHMAARSAAVLCWAWLLVQGGGPDDVPLGDVSNGAPVI